VLCLPYARLCSSVFSLLQKSANVRVESRIVNGSEFQSEGPEMAKLHDPYRASRLRAELSDRDEQLSGDVDDTEMHVSCLPGTTKALDYQYTCRQVRVSAIVHSPPLVRDFGTACQLIFASLI